MKHTLLLIRTCGFLDRPVIRPTHDLQQQFVLPPNTPPSSAEERDGKGWQQDHVDAADRQVRKQLPPTPPPKTPPRTRCGDGEGSDLFIKSSPPIPRTRHNRAHSYSTINDNCQTFKPPDFGGFRMKIDQVDGPTGEKERPRTAGHPNSFQTLDVQIPHYNLGSPHFSPNGTPFLYGASSLHIPSVQGELGTASTVSQQADRWLWPGADPTSLLSSAIPSPMPTPSIISSPTPDVQIPFMSLSSLISPSPRGQISPEIYNDLSFPPSSEDPLIVRYDPRTQEISAAIPARIISQITSAKFVDYHLLSDFFLTFRLFMSPSDLVAYLITRLRWAFSRDDDTGRVVRVRTFVAIRHWLLNYFSDDFVPSLPLREQFVKEMNELSNAVKSGGNPSDMKIIRELKRCWRRTCALYWDTSICVEVTIDQDIVAGGSPGVRYDPSRSHTTLLRPRTAAPRLESLLPDHSSSTDAFIRQVVEAPATPKDGGGKSLRFTSRSSSSSSSEQVKTPSLPCFAPERAPVTGRVTPPAQPVNSPFKSKTTKAHTPAGTMSTAEDTARKLRPSPHKRSGSFSDALRDTRQPLPLPKSLARSTHLLMAFPYAGSLVRGNLFPPTQAYVEVVAPSTPVNELASLAALTTFNSSNSDTLVLRAAQRPHDTLHGSRGVNGPGMRKFLGTVRRALSGKVGGNVGSNTMQPSMLGGRPSRQTSPLGSALPENMSLAGFMAANASKGNTRMLGDSKVARIDLLGAGVVEAFERAIQEEMTTEESGWERDDFQFNEENFLQNDGAQLDGLVERRTDEMIEVGSNVSQDGSASPDLAEIPPTKTTAKQTSIYDEELSHRSFVSLEKKLSQRDQLNKLGKLGQDAGSSAETDSVLFSGSSRLPRRSKSFSFESFQRNPYISQLAGMDNRSLHSARSFSMKRINSGRSQYSTGMDDISEAFGHLGSVENNLGGSLQPSRMLRRRPGGDLRAAATRGDFEMPRPRSAGSVGTATFSTADTFGVSIYHRPTSTIATSRAESPHQHVLAGVVSLGAVARGGGVPIPGTSRTPGRLSVARSLDLDPKISFEVGVQKLRDLPDTESDDGGIEVALMKLEGTYQKKKSSESSPTEDTKIQKNTVPVHSHHSRDSSVVMVGERGSEKTFGLDGVGDGENHLKRMKRRQKQVFDHTALKTVSTGQGSSVSQSVSSGSTRIAITNEGSEGSVPILERDLSINTFHFRETVMSNQSLPTLDRRLSHGSTPIMHRGLSPRPSPNDRALRSVDLGLEKHLNKSREHLRDDISELSSELSFEMVQPNTTALSTFPPMQPGTIIAELGIPSHPLRHPPSPPHNLDKTISIPPSQAAAVKNGTNVSAKSSRTEASRPTKPSGRTSLNTPGDRQNNDSDLPIRPSSIHLPFILAYDSELLAKQFTLIEKDALMEVDWKELVELRWSQTDSTVRDWVEFLNSKDIRGVEVVIARFNLVCLLSIYEIHVIDWL